MVRFVSLLGLLSCLFCGSSLAQSLKALKISERMPDILLGKFLNKSQKQEKISDLRGKLIIFDFWNIRCSNCIASMPKMDSLQKRFKDSIQIIFVTKNSEDDVRNLFSRIKIKKPDVPFIVGDTCLNQLFPHNGDPLHVWIDQNGFVRAITFDYSTNSFTIQKFLWSNNVHLPRRWDFGIDTDYPLLSEQNSGLLDLTTFHSALFQGLQEYYSSSMLRIQKDSVTKEPTRIEIINASLLELYNVGFNKDIYGMELNYFNLPKNNRIVLEMKDSSRLFPPHDESKLDTWINENTFGYEIKVPTGADIYKNMQDDLNRYFPYDAKIEKRKMKCLVLVDFSQQASELIKTKDSTNTSEIIYKNDGLIKIQNLPLSSFVLQLIYENPDLTMPLILGTSFNENIDLLLKSKLSDLKSLNKELYRYGLTLTVSEREIPMLIIKEKNVIANSRR